MPCGKRLDSSLKDLEEALENAERNKVAMEQAQRSCRVGHSGLPGGLEVVIDPDAQQIESLRFQLQQQWEKIDHLRGLVELKRAAVADSIRQERAEYPSAKPAETSPDQLQTESVADSTGSTKAKQTVLGRNIERLRKESGWSFDELATRTGLDKKLILGHVNKGKGAHPKTLKIYADAFTKRLGRPVSVTELEAGPINYHRNATETPPRYH